MAIKILLPDDRSSVFFDINERVPRLFRANRQMRSPVIKTKLSSDLIPSMAAIDILPSRYLPTFNPEECDCQTRDDAD